MNAKTAKKLRKAVGFNVHAERRYDRQTRGGPITAIGARRQYQAAKRTPDLASMILSAKVFHG